MSTNTFEQQILTCLKKLIVSNKTEQQEIFAEMKHELEKTLEQKTLRNDVMEVMMWVNSRLNDQPMTDFL